MSETASGCHRHFTEAQGRRPQSDLGRWSRAAQMVQVLCAAQPLTASLPSAPMNTQRPECAAMGLAARGMIAPNLSE